MPNRITGLQSGLDTESLITSMVSGYQKKIDKLNDMQKRHTWKQEVWKDINKQVLNFYNDTLGKMKYTSAYRTKITTVSNANAASVVTGENAMNGIHRMQVTSIASNSYMTGGKVTDAAGAAYTAKRNTKLSDLGFTGIQNLKVSFGGSPEETVLIDEEDTLSTVASKLRSVKTADGRSLNVNFDENNGRFFIASERTGANSDFTITSDSAQFLDALGISASTRMQYDAGTNAQITLDGVNYTSDKNTFEINDLVITTNEVTAGEITLNTQSDTKGMYDTIKDMIKKYSEMVNKLDKMYAAEDGSKYKMLTDDEKKAMSETEVKDWEKKIKDSTDPDATASFFRNLSVNLAERLHGLMGSTDYSSSYTLYEDKLMASQYSSYASKIFDATRTLNAKQDNYYKKFARMEKAMAQLNSTQNQLAGYFNTK